MIGIRTAMVWAVGVTVVPVLAAVGEELPSGRIQRDVAYSANGEACRLNVDAPAEGDGHPILVWIHGGAWRFGDKDLVQAQPKAFPKRGIVWVGVEYRMVPEVSYREQAGDVADAVRWARDHAREFGGNPDRIFLMGHSAGAHLAALTSTDAHYLKAVGMKLSDLSGTILLDGAGYDVPRQVRDSALPAVRALYLNVFGADPELQRDASPITHVKKDQGVPPFLLLHVGRRDSRDQSKALAAKLQGEGVEAHVAAFPSKTHRTINRELGTDGDKPTRAVFEFIRTHAEPAAESSPPPSRVRGHEAES